MSMDAAQAAQAYLSVGSRIGKLGTPTAGEVSQQAGGFGDMVRSVVEHTQELGKKVDTKGEELANGRADVVELVTAVAETELAVETMVTVRDRVISAYQEILNMPI
ncbi:MAG: flagellar hook-basal body complex protein FliE [Pseudomonadota bacterium]